MKIFTNTKKIATNKSFAKKTRKLAKLSTAEAISRIEREIKEAKLAGQATYNLGCTVPSEVLKTLEQEYVMTQVLGRNHYEDHVILL